MLLGCKGPCSLKNDIAWTQIACKGNECFILKKYNVLGSPHYQDKDNGVNLQA